MSNGKRQIRARLDVDILLKLKRALRVESNQELIEAAIKSLCILIDDEDCHHILKEKVKIPIYISDKDIEDCEEV